MNPKQVNGVGGGVVQSFRFKRVKILREPHRRRGLGLVLPCIYETSEFIHVHTKQCTYNDTLTFLYPSFSVTGSGQNSFELSHPLRSKQSATEIIPMTALRNDLPTASVSGL